MQSSASRLTVWRPCRCEVKLNDRLCLHSSENDPFIHFYHIKTRKFYRPSKWQITARLPAINKITVSVKTQTIPHTHTHRSEATAVFRSCMIRVFVCVCESQSSISADDHSHVCLSCCSSVDWLTEKNTEAQGFTFIAIVQTKNHHFQSIFFLLFYYYLNSKWWMLR